MPGRGKRILTLQEDPTGQLGVFFFPRKTPGSLDLQLDQYMQRGPPKPVIKYLEDHPMIVSG